jgi:hypothetical protein
VPICRLLTAIERGDLFLPADEPHWHKWLEALQGLITPDGPWARPLVRAICHCPAAPGADSNSVVRLTIAVYFTRLLFELIACEQVKTDPSSQENPKSLKTLNPNYKKTLNPKTLLKTPKP